MFILMLTPGLPIGILKMRILSTSFLEIRISSFYQVICFLCGMATIGCRLGCLTSNVCIMKILNGTIHWTLLCSIPHMALWSSSPPWQTWTSQFPPFDDVLNSQCTIKKRAFSNQPIFNYMLSSTLFWLHNNINLKKLHMDGMAFQMSWRAN